MAEEREDPFDTPIQSELLEVSNKMTVNYPITTSQSRAKWILTEANTLLAEDPARFLNVLEELTKKANSLTGKNHPLEKVVGRRRDDPMREVMMQNIREAHKRNR